MSLPAEVWKYLKGLKQTYRPVKDPPESHLGSFSHKINSVRRLAHGSKPEAHRLPTNHDRVSAGRAE